MFVPVPLLKILSLTLVSKEQHTVGTRIIADPKKCFQALIFDKLLISLVAQCSATPATVAATPPCSATPFQTLISVRHLRAQQGGGGRCDT